MNQINIASQGKNARSRWNSFIKDSGRDLKKNKYIYIMAIPIILYFVIFHYIPLYGNVMAFQDYSPGKGFLGSPFVGFQHFVDFFYRAILLAAFQEYRADQRIPDPLGFPDSHNFGPSYE
ncbi:hypothetical protein [Ruminiclostridium cellobioparum]|uniref:hypothetical protein n=1 Tax=Ruminiclostridium cellobioparum TaxID=29355 RepID=UPI00034C9CB5